MTAMTASRIEISPTGAAIGAEIVGVDLSRTLNKDVFRQIDDAWNRYTVLVFRNQALTPEQQISFGAQFGPLEIHVAKKALLPGYPEILLVSNIKNGMGEDIGLSDAGQTWHTDTSYRKRPSRGSILHALEIPIGPGGKALGDTLFAGTAAAYDDLAPEMKRKLDGKKAVHSYGRRRRPEGSPRAKQPKEVLDKTPDVAHPIVRKHPKTGRKALYVFEGECVGIEGMPDSEAVPLIEQLTRHCIQDKYIYRHKWRVGDLVMWDNAASLHLAICDYKLPQRRLLHRVTIEGGVPA
jgi:taurine dioxygenase